MTLQEFDKYTLQIQLQYLSNNGLFLCSRNESSCKIDLFWVDGFFVEKYFTKDTDKLLHLTTFQKNADLDPYLPNIHLDY